MNPIAFLTALLPAPVSALCAIVSTPLAEYGRALEPIVVSANANAEAKGAADTLADYLGRISGARFEVKTGDGESGIVVGRAEDFPKLKTGVAFHPSDAMRGEEYLLRSQAHGVWLLGDSDLAVRHPVWVVSLARWGSTAAGRALTFGGWKKLPRAWH